METEKQHKKQYDWLRGYQFTKGQSGNPGGRPKGAKSMKTFVREYFENLPDEEKVLFLKSIPNPLDAWKMGEGNPAQDNNNSGEIKIINVNVPAPLAEAFNINATANTETSGSDTE